MAAVVLTTPTAVIPVLLRKLKLAHCITCRHSERARIDLALASGRPLRDVAREFGLHKDCLQRHWQNHVSEERKLQLVGGPVALDKLARKAAEEDRSLIDYYAILRSQLFAAFQSAMDRGMTFDAASLADRLLRTLDSIAKLTGQLRAAGITVNVANSVNAGPTLILNSPEVVRLQSTIIRALSGFPEARNAVVASLRDMDGAPALPAPLPASLNGSAPPPVIEAELVDA
jgi:hypothetical protein